MALGLTCLLRKPENMASDHQSSCGTRHGATARLHSQHSKSEEEGEKGQLLGSSQDS